MKILSSLPPQGHLAEHFLKSLVLVLQLCPSKGSSPTLRHKWTCLIDFLSSRIALIAANMADESSWLCVHWDK